MDFSILDRFTILLFAAALVACVVFWLIRKGLTPRTTQTSEGRVRALDQVDTVIGWPPQVTRVMTPSHAEALQLLQRALPERVVLAQVPLSHFVRVPTRHSYAEWIRRIGHVTVDLMICDRRGRVLSIIDLRPAGKSRTESARKRHQRLARLLEAADVPLHVWDENHLPELSSVRRAFSSRSQTRSVDQGPDTSPLTMPPVHQKDPPLSGWFDELHATRPTKLDSVEVIHSDTLAPGFQPTRSPEAANGTR